MGLVFVLPNQFFAAKLIEVLVVFPKLEVYVLALITGHLIKDTQIGCTVVRAELLHNLSQESHLLICQEFRALHGV